MTTNEKLRGLLRDIENYLDRVGEFDQTYRPGTRPTNTPAELLLRLRAALAEPSAAPAPVVMPDALPYPGDDEFSQGFYAGNNAALEEIARLNASPAELVVNTECWQLIYDTLRNYRMGTRKRLME